MANYHLNMSYGKVGKTNAHFNYITASGKYAGKEKELAYESHNMPYWIKSPKEFWELADKNERVNGRTYREVRISLPEELNKKENIELLNQFLKENFSGHYYSVVIHDKETQLDFEYMEKHKNIHAHIMFSPRVIDNIERKDPNKYFKRANSKNPERGGAAKDPKWDEVETLLKLRKDWELLQNKYLELHNINARVSCETLEKQRQQALEKGDFDKYEQLNRLPVHINGATLNRTNKTEYEKELIKEFLASREIKSIKDKIYQEILNERAKNKETINEFDASISKKEKENVYNKLMAKKNKIDSNNLLISQLQNINIKNKIYSKLIPGYREKADELNNLIKEHELFTQEEFNFLAQKYNDIKAMETTIDSKLFEKEKEKLINDIHNNIEKLEKENIVLNDEIQQIFINNSKNKEFIKELENNYLNIDAKKSINNIILATKDKENVQKKLDLIELQLSNSRKTTLNILSKKKYIPLEKEIKKLKEELLAKESVGDPKQIEILKSLINKKEKELKDIEISCTKDIDKFVRIKESFEKKLHDNKAELNIKLQAINNSIDNSKKEILLSNKEVRTHLSNTINSNKELLELNKEKLEKLKFIKKTLNKDIKELEVIAYLSLTKGNYGKLQNKFSENMNRIDQINIELIKLKENKLFNIFSIKKLEKEKTLLVQESNRISKKFKELKSSISPKDLTNEILRIKTALSEKESNIDKQIQDILAENKELDSINNICYNLYNNYKDLEQKPIYEKSLDLFTGNTITKNTGSWNIKIESDNEKIIRL